MLAEVVEGKHARADGGIQRNRSVVQHGAADAGTNLECAAVVYLNDSRVGQARDAVLRGGGNVDDQRIGAARNDFALVDQSASKIADGSRALNGVGRAFRSCSSPLIPTIRLPGLSDIVMVPHVVTHPSNLNTAPCPKSLKLSVLVEDRALRVMLPPPGSKPFQL